MSEEILNTEIQSADNEKIEKIKIAVDALKNKKSKFLFCVPESQNPVASIYEIYFHATTVKKMGFGVTILTEKGDYVPPTWIEAELTAHEHMSMSDPKLTVGPDSVMVIPEVYSNVMEQTKDLPCLRIGFLQSVDYMMNSLIPGTDWKSFGISNIVTTSEMLREWVRMYYGNKFNVKTYKIGIPEYFKTTDFPQKPIISVVGRNPNEIAKLVKLFYTKYPQYSWITFDPMLTKSKPPQTMRRVDFAKRLRGNFAAVWVDRIASFGTFPLECMKSGVIPICLKPDIMPEYMIERDENGVANKVNNEAGVWTENFYDLPSLMGEFLIKFLDDSIPQSVYVAMSKVASKFNVEESEKELMKTYQEFVDERITFFENALK
jgi:hypothetical protein